MTKLDLLEFASSIAQDNNSFSMLPVIEKELLHYEILEALDREGLLDTLTFQGGTCLRLCYGALRYSEDLDFAGGPDFDFNSISQIKEVLESSLDARYSIDPIVTEKETRIDDSGASIKKWQVKVITALERPDIPMQRISIEVASVPAHTFVARPLILNYDVLPTSYSNIILRAETLEEICADKLKAFLTASYMRYRDLWDINWIARRASFDHAALKDLFQQKLIDYKQEKTAQVNAARILEIPQILNSREFIQQMSRFIPASIAEQTIDRAIYREAMGNEIQELYRLVV